MKWWNRLTRGARYDKLLDALTDALQRGAHGEAATMAEEAVTLAASMFGEAHAELVAPLYALASAHLAAGELVQAAMASERAVAVAEALEGKSVEPNLASLWEQRAAIADREGDAEGFTKALREVIAAAPNDPLLRAVAHNRLGLQLARVGNYADAQSHFNEALDLRRRDDAESLAVAEVLHNAATFRDADSEEPAVLKEAAERFASALKIAEKHLSTAASLLEAKIAHNYAVLRQEQLDDDAEDLYRRALAAFERDHGADDPVLRPTLARLGRLMQAARRFEEAVPLLERAHGIAVTELGADHDVTSRLAIWLGDANSDTYR